MAPAKQQRLIGACSQLPNPHKALNALGGDHSVANLQLDEFDWENAGKEYPELEADKPPIRSRFAMIAGGML